MNLTEQVTSFIEDPFPPWRSRLTVELVNAKIADYTGRGLFVNYDSYNTTIALYRTLQENHTQKQKITERAGSVSYLEEPDFRSLNLFYNENGLEPLTSVELEENNVILKLNKAFGLLAMVDDCYTEVVHLVKTIQVLRQQHPEYDISYSHPEIPFSIFVTAGTDTSVLSGIRVAESILHEAMHLKLTLIEWVVALVDPTSKNTFFSPWREEQRPLRGVLHGLFVFRTIGEFYSKALGESKDTLLNNFMEWRIEQIQEELAALKTFPTSPGLTQYGATLSANLLP